MKISIFIVLILVVILIFSTLYSCISTNQLDVHQLRVESVKLNINTGKVTGYFYDIDSNSYITLVYSTELFNISLNDFLALQKGVIILLCFESNNYKSYNY